jgi:pimeloyl-ACP methyl ester carboxylesterase
MVIARVHGQRDTTAAVLLHGQPGSAHVWRRVLDQIPEDVYALAVNRPGYGDNQATAAGIADNAEALMAMLDEEGIERAVLVAHSWASAVALRVAIAAPERIIGMVLVSPVGATGSITLVDRVLARRWVGRIASRMAISALRTLLPQPVLAGAVAGEPLPIAATTGRAISQRMRTEQVWRSFFLEQQMLVRELPALTATLDTVRTPTVIITGSRDRVVRPQVARRLAHSIGAAEYVEIATAGHMVPIQEPAQISDVLLRLIRGTQVE